MLLLTSPARALRAKLALWRHLALASDSPLSAPGPHPIRLKGPTLDARLWPSPSPTADTTVILLPGLHMDGPADTRMDRLARALRRAGAHVLAPHVAPFEALTIADRGPEPIAVQGCLAAFDWIRAALPTPRVGLFSVSFGSILALHLMRERPIHRAVLFGAYADLPSALAFALGAGEGARRDPLNGPAIYLNVARALLPEEEIGRFTAACRSFCAQTWSRSERPALKDGRRFAHVLDGVSRPLSGHARDLLYEAVGLIPGGGARILAALDADPGPFAWADPRPLLPHIPCPVDLVHGQDDDVIPSASARTLAEGLPDARAWLTGAWSHTGATAAGPGGLRAAGAAARTSLAVMQALERLVRGA